MTIFIWLILIGIAIWYIKHAMDRNDFRINDLIGKNGTITTLKKYFSSLTIMNKKDDDK